MRPLSGHLRRVRSSPGHGEQRRGPDRTRCGAAIRREVRGRGERDDGGLTLVELLVAFAALMILLTMVGTAISTYLNVGTNVVSSYQATDQLLPSSITIQRLFRSQVEPAPTPTAATGCAVANAPCPPFLTGSVGTFSTTFYANIGDPNGPAKIVMGTTGPPTRCAGCKFYSSVFTVTQYPACPNPPASGVLAGCTSSTPACPFTVISTATCTWSTAGRVLVDVPGVVNGLTYLTNATPPTIFTYNTLDPYSTAYTSGAGGTPNAVTGILPGFNSCAAPTLTAGNPSSSNCPPDMVQSVGVDLQVEVAGTSVQENSFVVYRLSSTSYLYSPLVG
jgi:Prokaryotic N-terminal methylation motif